MSERLVRVRDGSADRPVVEVAVETFGDPRDPTLLLVMGMSVPMTWWPRPLCDALADRGLHVVRFDNRDSGRSTHLTEHRRTRLDVARTWLGDRSRVVYTLDDLAADAIAVLDGLGIDRAHVAGQSMGGMIAQLLAIGHPDRVLSLTSIMSTTGSRTVGWQHPRMLRGAFLPRVSTLDDYIAESRRRHHLMRSPAYPMSEADQIARARETWERGWSTSGSLRQLLAIVAAPDRTAALRRLDLPAAVVHGADDPVVDVSGGRATAHALSGSELVVLPGVGHELPGGIVPELVEVIVRLTRRTHHPAS